MVREEIEALHRISDDYHTLYVPLADKFEEMCQVREPSYWIWDGIHPTEAGHGVIADPVSYTHLDVYKRQIL